MGSLIIFILFSSSAFAFQDTAQAGLQAELEITETGEFIFGGISGIKVDDSGRMFVSDPRQFQVKVFDADGAFLQTLGQQGRGPGEFQELTSFDLAGDELVVLDNELHRVSYFDLSTLEHTEEFTFKNVQTEVGSGYPQEIFYLSDSRVAVLSTIPGSTANADKDRWKFLTIYNRDGETVKSQIIRKPEDEVLVRKPTPTSVQVADRPLGRKSIYRKDNEGHIWYCWTDRLKLERYDLSGTLVNSIETDMEDVPVENGDYGRLGNLFGDMVAFHNQYGATPHSTWPVVEDFIPGEEGRVWVLVRSGAPDDLSWLAMAGDGRHLRQFQVPAGESIMAIQNRKVYSRTRTEEGSYSIKRYIIVP